MKYGERFYERMAMLARDYLDLQHLRIAAEARIRELEPIKGEDETILNTLITHGSRLKKDEKDLLKEIMVIIGDHPIWQYCQSVRGFGDVAAMTLLGYINPYKAETAGQAKSYIGWVPHKELKKGAKANMNIEAKGRFWVVCTNVLMGLDPYYSPLFYKKKEYYLTNSRIDKKNACPKCNRVFYKPIDTCPTCKVETKIITTFYPPFNTVIEDPTTCPDYQECLDKLQKKAKRLNREVKTPPCKAHCDNQAKRWMGGIIISHALEIMRRTEGFDTKVFEAHNNYIPTPPINYGEPCKPSMVYHKKTGLVGPPVKKPKKAEA